MNIASMRPAALAAMLMTVTLGVVVALPAPAVASANEVRVAVLRGENETGVADPDAVGVGIFGINTATGEICYLLAHVKIDGTITAAHIHRAPAGVNGPVVVGLQTPVEHITRACATAAPALAADIAANPANYYANIHTSLYPAGAVRGQLGP